MRWLCVVLLLALRVSAQETGVICLSALPAPNLYGSAGKGASEPATYDDSAEARAARVASAQTRAPVVFSVGKISSVPVTSSQAACIDGLELGKPLLLKGLASAIPFTLTKDAPVRWLTYSPFYGSVGLDPLEPRLFCPKRSPTPDCSWCPCRAWKYLPPPTTAPVPNNEPAPHR